MAYEEVKIKSLYVESLLYPMTVSTVMLDFISEIAGVCIFVVNFTIFVLMNRNWKLLKYVISLLLNYSKITNICVNMQKSYFLNVAFFIIILKLRTNYQKMVVDKTEYNVRMKTTPVSKDQRFVCFSSHAFPVNFYLHFFRDRPVNAQSHYEYIMLDKRSNYNHMLTNRTLSCLIL